MIYNDILSQEELEALLTPEELETFKAEQQSQLEHELTLSPAHLLLAVRELGDTVARLTARVQQLESQLAQRPAIFEPEVLQVVNQVIETALFEMPIMHLEGNSLTAVSIYEEDPAALENIEVTSDVIVTEEVLPIPTEHEAVNVPAKVEGLISRSVRHRERKPSLISKLLK
jgi:hypothetical protein